MIKRGNQGVSLPYYALSLPHLRKEIAMSYTEENSVIIEEPILPTAAIRWFIDRNPINRYRPKLARLSGAGDSAGAPPTSAVREFMQLYKNLRHVPTQREYFEHCVNQWVDWWCPLTSIQKKGVRSKCYSNFYPSYVTQIHAHAIIEEMGFHPVIDTYLDCRKGVDIVVRTQSEFTYIALTSGSFNAKEMVAHKHNSIRKEGMRRDFVYVHQSGAWFTAQDFSFLRNIQSEYNPVFFAALGHLMTTLEESRRL